MTYLLWLVSSWVKKNLRIWFTASSTSMRRRLRKEVLLRRDQVFIAHNASFGRRISGQRNNNRGSSSQNHNRHRVQSKFFLIKGSGSYIYKQNVGSPPWKKTLFSLMHKTVDDQSFLAPTRKNTLSVRFATNLAKVV